MSVVYTTNVPSLETLNDSQSTGVATCWAIIVGSKDALGKRLAVSIVWNEHYEQGQISSLKTGLRNVSVETQAVLVWPVDLPLVKEQTIAGILSSYLQNLSPLTIPVHNSRRGHPVLYDREAMNAVFSLTEKQTAKDLIAKYSDRLSLVTTDDPGVLIDIDTEDDYRKYVFR